jgi:predicted dehydrogenase
MVMVQVGVIGYGYWGPNLVRNLMEIPDCSVVAICDRREDRLAMASRRCPSARVTTEADSVIDDPSIVVVVVATPVASHYDLAWTALRKGKHVLVEKPLTTSSAQADVLIEEAKRQKRILMVDHTFAYTGAVREIKSLISSGELGKIHYLDSVRINLGLFQHDVNVLWDLAVHDLSIADHVLSEPVAGVAAQAFRHFPGQPANLAYLTLAYESGTVAHVHVNWLAPVKMRRTVLAGSRKMVVYDDLEPSDKVKVYDTGVDLVDDESSLHKMLVSYRVGEMRAPRVDLGEALGTEMRHLLDCVKHGRVPLTDGCSGRRVVKLLELAQRSIDLDGMMVRVD